MTVGRAAQCCLCCLAPVCACAHLYSSPYAQKDAIWSSKFLFRFAVRLFALLMFKSFELASAAVVLVLLVFAEVALDC